MQLADYLNHLDSSNDLFDYEYGKIDPETADLSDSDKETLELIMDIIRLNEKYKQKEAVFEQINSKRLPKLDSIKREDLLSILSLDLNTLPLVIRARIADFLWTTIKDYKSAIIAIQAYLELYELTWDEDQWPDCIDAIYRAVNIAQSLDKKVTEKGAPSFAENVPFSVTLIFNGRGGRAAKRVAEQRGERMHERRKLVYRAESWVAGNVGI